MNKADIVTELRKAMEFYRELGFDFLPLKGDVPVGPECARVPAGNAHTAPVADAGDPCPDRQGSLVSLRDEIGDCRRCRLWQGRKNIVFGEGNSCAKLMFIGEGPGRDEDIQARPFVGSAGKLLTSLITKLGLKREDVYIANIVKCRPPGNRNPEVDEISTCIPFVEKQIDIISPQVIVCLGKISAQALLRSSIPISRMRGSFFHFRTIPVMPTFHPAYLLRNPKDKWLTWEDMQKVLEKIR
ncbi:MAG: uracil-DNA glycosylase [Nitrospiraceae bacterium]|nr:MAG: uracil-DNA glycosylase [Nitrospiraceae bacterium]